MFLSFILSIIMATTIITGDSYSKSTVTNQVEGGNVYTRIEVEANGEKKILESSKSGTHQVEVRSSGSSSAQVAVESIISATPSAQNNTPISVKIKNIFDRIIKIFSFFPKFILGRS